MLEILRSASGLLVLHHELEPGEGQTIDGFGRVDDLVDVDLPVRPALTNGDRTIREARNLDTVLGKRDDLTEYPSTLPRIAARHHIEIIVSIDDTADDQGSAPEHRVVADREIERSDRIEELCRTFVHDIIS